MNTNALEVKINAVQILKNLARNLEGSLRDYVEPIAKVMIEQLLTDPYAMTIRKEAAKCMRFCIAACKDTPAPQRALFIMAYVKMMEELDKRRVRMEFDQVNGILKEIAKMLRLFEEFPKDVGTVFTPTDAGTLLTRLREIADLIKTDKETRRKQMAKLAANVDEEDMEFFEEDLAKVDKGIHHIMEISGFLLRNMGAAISEAVATTLLPFYATPLLEISSREEYELIDSVCMLCDCLEYGSEALFNQISGQAGPKFVELLHYAGKKDRKKGEESPPNYDLL